MADQGRRKYVIESYGCQMNVHDAERLAGLLEESGYARAESAAQADLVVINTCSVRERAEEKLYHRLDEVRRQRMPHAVVAVAGCVAQQEGDRLIQRARDVRVVVGTQALKQLPGLAEAAFEQSSRVLVDVNPYEDVSFPLGTVRHSDPVRAYVTVIEGCNDHCSFCVVPRTRGHERMRPVREVLGEVEQAVASGRREVHLLGQIVNHYSAPDDPRCDFAELLTRVSAVRGVERIRFASPHPRHVTRRFIDVLATLPNVCRHLHLPVQSGSTAVLHRMRRRHSREDYLRLVDDLRKAMPDLALSTDIIVGFPGESEVDFRDTLTLVEQVGFRSMFSFKYSPRPGTLAAKRLADDVAEPEKTRRILELQHLQKSIQQRLAAREVGTQVEVLIDGPSKRRSEEVSGRTSQNVVVNLPGPPSWIGRMALVRVERATAFSLWGRAVSVEGQSGTGAEAGETHTTWEVVDAG